MIRHPLLLAVLVMDTFCLLLLAAAAVDAFRTVLDWSPQSADRQQIELERKSEAVSINTRYALVTYVAATIMLVVGISNVLPQLVPGAMCGTGVLQATKGVGTRALIFRFVVIAAMYVWYLLDRFSRSQPDAPLTLPTSRTLLLVMPLLFLAFTSTSKAVMNLDLHQPVDCCAAVYDQVRSLQEARSAAGIPDTYWLWSFVLLSMSNLTLGFGVWRSTSPRAGLNALLMVLSLLWAAVAGITLVRVLAAYYYGVLQHHCPWCLFLPEHHLIGYPLFLALALAALEGSAAVVTAITARKYPELHRLAARRSQWAGLGIMAATSIFLLLAGLPALIWKLRFGVWMN